MAPPRDSQAKTGRAALRDLLQRDGPISADALAAKLGITAMAVRQHLYALHESGDAAFAQEARPRGRPVKLWRATAAAAAHFADSHASLATDLIVQMKKAFGEDGLDRLLALRNADLEKTYRGKTDKAQTLKAKLDALAKLRSAEGYMAEVRREPGTGHWLFVENHCPICAAARLCTGLCREELALFHRVLGKDIKVERLSHILAGAGRCAYRVTPV
ncbi:MAG TPA: HTH domain-containing protein [Rhizomicrobium sp.]|jgi:predicted ArsR family transcriptional regulator|nr:HTH domain-containing protein [Rhizomicrobium sp.]